MSSIHSGSLDSPDFSLNVKDGVSLQERLMAQMSPAQIRLYRQNAMKEAVKQGKFASSHNTYMRESQEAIHQAERLTNQKLKKLIAQAKNKAGIDAGELLDFTLGKTQKNKALKDSPLSPAILQYFLENLKTANAHFKGGISPQQIINQSRPADIKRSNEQIFLATVFKRQGNVLHFLTNAGPNVDTRKDGAKRKSSKPKALNHKVTVELVDFPTLITGQTKPPDNMTLKNFLTNNKVKFDCDCGRHQYWYRYIATVGKFNFGIHENRYPSTRNPQLTGVACKHVLRVMQTLMSGEGVQMVRGYIKQDLTKGHNKVLSSLVPKGQIQKAAERHASPRVAEHWRKRIEKALKAQVKFAFAELKPMSTQQQYQQAVTLKRAGMPLSPAQKSMLQPSYMEGAYYKPNPKK